MLIVADTHATFLLSGTGDVIEPDDGVVAVGSGGPYALAAARALARHSALDAREIAEQAMTIAADICIYTNRNPDDRGAVSPSAPFFFPNARASAVGSLTPREIVAELDNYIVGQAKAKRAVAIALRNRWRRQQLPPDMADEVTPKNILMIGPTGVGKTEIARRLARLAQSPFIKVEASKFTEVGYVGRDVESMVRDLVELAVDMVRAEKAEEVQEKARAGRRGAAARPAAAADARRRRRGDDAGRRRAIRPAARASGCASSCATAARRSRPSSSTCATGADAVVRGRRRHRRWRRSAST